MEEKELLELEEQGWRALASGQASEFYRTHLADDALMVVPGMVLDGQTFLQGADSGEPWATFEIEDPRVVGLTENSAVVVYRVTAQRAGQPPYVAHLASAYARREGTWKLVYHQQTPIPQ
jgi:hypothetical protein